MRGRMVRRTEFLTLETSDGPESIAITAAHKELVAQAHLGDWVRVTFRGKEAMRVNGRTFNAWDCEIADEGDPDPDHADQD